VIELGVTLDAVALLRESRKTRGPDPVFAAFLAEQAGASAINVQLRSDGHTQDGTCVFCGVRGVELNLVITRARR
jgi:pyridoxine 5-phosphate synthase